MQLTHNQRVEFKDSLYFSSSTIKAECLNHFILQTEEQLRYVVLQYLEYYNHERPHSGIGEVMIHPLPQDEDGEITMFSRLGGFLKSYRRTKAAS